VTYEEVGKPNLVIDEAHNLPSRSTDYYSPSLSSYQLEKMREELRLLPKKYAEAGEDLLDQALLIIRGFAPASGKSEKVNLKIEPFLALEEELKGYLSKYLDSDVEIKSRDVVLRFVFYWSEFTEILKDILGSERPEFFISFYHEKTGGVIKITCCDASEMLKPRYENFEQVVAFSATLKPFAYYAELSGLNRDDLITSEFSSPFEKSQRKILVIPQVSTKYSERERNYEKIAETIRRVSEVKNGNYLAFFPSFDFLEKTAFFLQGISGFQIIKQNRYMKNNEVEDIIEGLKSGRPTIVLGVQGGHFSEGVDYPGDMVIGAFVIGPPLPNFDFERENIKQYFEASYQQGFDYAYTFPAMAKAVQSAGRVIRSETDKGIIVLMDDRFLQTTYSKTMPVDWFEETPRELVSQSILKDIQEFWLKGER
jgi:DNA excision repair protein ERCC-2